MTNLHQAIVEQAPEAVFLADREGVIRLWNARAEEIFGYAAGEAVGRSLDLIIPPHLREAHWRGYRQAVAAGRTRSVGIVSDQEHQVLGALATARQGAKPQASG